MNVVLILGAGANIGRLSAMAFKAAGFKIAIASRSLTDGVNDDGWLTLCLDLGISHDIQSVFDKVKLHFDQAPNVVIYNGQPLIANLCANIVTRLEATPAPFSPRTNCYPL